MVVIADLTDCNAPLDVQSGSEWLHKAAVPSFHHAVGAPKPTPRFILVPVR